MERFTLPGDVVLDPFAGSGTTLVVANEKKRVAKGAEIDKQAYNIAKARL
jgi:DNA modification methylase